MERARVGTRRRRLARLSENAGDQWRGIDRNGDLLIDATIDGGAPGPDEPSRKPCAGGLV